jgi:hypothetical protein
MKNHLAGGKLGAILVRNFSALLKVYRCLPLDVKHIYVLSQLGCKSLLALTVGRLGNLFST